MKLVLLGFSALLLAGCGGGSRDVSEREAQLRCEAILAPHPYKNAERMVECIVQRMR